MTTVEEVKAKVKARHSADDPEFFIHMVMNHEGHIRRSKAKAERYQELRNYRDAHPILWGLRIARAKRRLKRAMKKKGGERSCSQNQIAAGLT